MAHLDMDAFYASVELLRHPELKGLPVIVSGSGPRAVVTTCTYEARTYGVHSALPTARALRLCPHATLIRPDFAAYKEASGRVWSIVRDEIEANKDNREVLEEMRVRIETRSWVEPSNSLWQALRHLIRSRLALDPHTAYAHLRNAMDEAWNYGVTDLRAHLLEVGIGMAKDLGVYSAEERYLE